MSRTANSWQNSAIRSRLASVRPPYFSHKRQLMDRNIASKFEHGTELFCAQILLKQPNLADKSSKTPQGHRPNIQNIGTFKSLAAAEHACDTMCPPVWEADYTVEELSSKRHRNPCFLCNTKATFLSKIHHCRNCGLVVCNACSSKRWPSSMVPITYHNQSSSKIRTCDACHALMMNFVIALISGDLISAQATYNTGNVNLFCPLSCFKGGGYPIHYAVMGGNLEIVKWLVDGMHCGIYDDHAKEYLKNDDSLDVLMLAAEYNHVHIMRYLVNDHRMPLTNFKTGDKTHFASLLRVLHFYLVEEGGSLPPPSLPREVPTAPYFKVVQKRSTCVPAQSVVAGELSRQITYLLAAISTLEPRPTEQGRAQGRGRGHEGADILPQDSSGEGGYPTMPAIDQSTLPARSSPPHSLDPGPASVNGSTETPPHPIPQWQVSLDSYMGVHRDSPVGGVLPPRPNMLGNRMNSSNSATSTGSPSPERAWAIPINVLPSEEIGEVVHAAAAFRPLHRGAGGSVNGGSVGGGSVRTVRSLGGTRIPMVTVSPSAPLVISDANRSPRDDVIAVEGRLIEGSPAQEVQPAEGLANGPNSTPPHAVYVEVVGPAGPTPNSAADTHRAQHRHNTRSRRVRRQEMR
jgi:hypothetical protein